MDDAQSRVRRMVGDAGVARLSSSCVAVFGLGGVGASCAEALVRGGVGSLVLVDRDVVEPSNLNRQAIAFRSTVGASKVQVMRAMALQINAEVRTLGIHDFITEQNAPALFASIADRGFRVDYVVDAIDTLTAKAALAAQAAARGIPSVASMGMANRTDPTKLAFADLYQTEGCPFCREMRKICRAREVDRMQVLYSTERPQKVKPAPGAERRERTELGTMSYMPPIAGLMLAGFVICRLLGRDGF